MRQPWWSKSDLVVLLAVSDYEALSGSIPVHRAVHTCWAVGTGAHLQIGSDPGDANVMMHCNYALLYPGITGTFTVAGTITSTCNACSGSQYAPPPHLLELAECPAVLRMQACIASLLSYLPSIHAIPAKFVSMA